MTVTEAIGTLPGKHSNRADFLPLRVDAGRADIAKLTRLLRDGARPANEQFDQDEHLDEVIPKPWGYEYRAYVDDFFDFWSLHIDGGHSTSVHVHPRKLTYLLCLGGQGVTTGLDREEIPVHEGAILRIAPGAFHGTRSTGTEPLELIEVEVPRNKFDLIRLHDDYNRAGTAYESASIEEPMHRMRKVPSLPHAKMRDRTPDRRFRFDLRTGMDIFYRPQETDLFYIPLHISGVVRSDCEILTGHPDDRRRPQTDKQYLCISKNV
ncbi:cupin domain-containing protein [Streptomyces castrisilvae]|uniref:Cupin domain-containing protein n=1 Tax=Streptomyces castrisilvae TaxID=3033811 RepID=A0ABY9HN36_9ACTN|nr:cupin domain-containing protein [Streptomyces sp. Mut1]WLQ35749.1 cupin domain-containing protein [Streptomyces sp. Mut1]